MSLLKMCKKYFKSADLYKVLEIDKNATEKDIKKAYHKLSLKVHPDRVSEEEKLEATEKFKVLGKIHSILSDKNKRAVYDETGTVDDEDEVTERNWDEYWRILFKPISLDDIKEYEKSYIGSELELKDLKKAYLNGKGDMDFITDHVQFARAEQEPRLRELVIKMIDDGEVPAYKIFTHEPEKKRKKRHAKQKREADEIDEIEKNSEKENGMNDLALMIKEKQLNRGAMLDNFLDGLAAKYGEGSKEKRSNKRKTTTKSVPSKKRKT